MARRIGIPVPGDPRTRLRPPARERARRWLVLGLTLRGTVEFDRPMSRDDVSERHPKCALVALTFRRGQRWAATA